MSSRSINFGPRIVVNGSRSKFHVAIIIVFGSSLNYLEPYKGREHRTLVVQFKQ